MIVVIEGVSAAGKTTWCGRHDGVTVPEWSGIAPAASEPHAATEFWADANCRRWADAERIEAEHGIAYCDTDPFKLHYAWSLWRIGRCKKEDWEVAAAANRRAIQARRLGFADATVFLEPDPVAVRAQKESDSSRRRGNFELHQKIGPVLREWYEMIDQARPGCVQWHGERLTEVVLAKKNYDRFDLTFFDALTKLAARSP